ncbi:MAG: hypothetical protein RI953_1782 [Pseudomonadota bacterium]|jgi:hypothetical protein
MTVKTFYNSELALTVCAGVFAIAASPNAFAAPLAPPNEKTTTRRVESALPRVSEGARSETQIKHSSLFMTPPPQVPGAGRMPTVTDVLGRAFTRDDLNSLYGAGGFASCETSSRIPSFFEKNYSNFAAGCMEDFRSRQAINFDERFQSNPESQGIAVSPLGGRIQWNNISAGARERLLQRSINDLAQKNKTLSDILQGRISFDFGIGRLLPGGNSSAAKSEAPRPRYVVEVIDTTSPGKRNKSRTLLASLGKLPDGSIKKEGLWFSQRPFKSRRTLKETFEPGTSTAKLDDESLIPATASANKDSNTGEVLSSMRYMARQAGLSDLPFTKVNMRAERRIVEGRNQVALRATESQDLFFAEIPNIGHASSSSLVWGYKVPWHKHAVSVRIDEGAQEKITTYSFKIDDSNKSELNYNHKSNAVSAGFTVTF